MKITYIPTGVCAAKMELELDETRTITNLTVMGGCSGNLQGICALVKGMKAEEVIERLSGIRCGMKSTSCPDQLTRALAAALEN